MPGAVILKGSAVIGMLADCAESALIVRPSAAVSSVFFRFMGKRRCSPPLRGQAGNAVSAYWWRVPELSMTDSWRRSRPVTHHTRNIQKQIKADLQLLCSRNAAEGFGVRK